MAVIETLQLGSLTLIGEHMPTAVRVTVVDDLERPAGFLITTAQWNSLLALADTQRHAGGAIVALQAQLDDVAEAIGPERMRAADGYHGTAVRSLLALADTKLAGEREAERLRAELSALREANGQLAAIAMRNRPLRVQVDDNYFQEHRVGPSPDERALILKLRKAGTP